MTMRPSDDRGASKEMWAQYWGDPSITTRNPIVERYLYLVNREVRLATHRPSAIFDLSDLRQVALIALIAAVEKWVPSRNDNFEAWATFRIRGDIGQALRTTADPLSRTLRARSREIDAATDQLRAVLGREPTRTEIAEYLDIDVKTLEHWENQIANRPLDSLDTRPDGAGSVYAPEDVEGQVMQNETASRLMEALARLDADEREMIVRVNVHGDSFQTIAIDLGVSRATARTRYARAFERLRREFLAPPA